MDPPTSPQVRWLDLVRDSAAVLVCSAAGLILLYNLYDAWSARVRRIELKTEGSDERASRTRRTQQSGIILDDVQRNRLTDEVPLAFGRFRWQVRAGCAALGLLALLDLSLLFHHYRSPGLDTAHMVFTLAQTVLVVQLSLGAYAMPRAHSDRLHTHNRLLWQAFYLCASHLMLQYITSLALILTSTDLSLPLGSILLVLAQLFVAGLIPRAPELAVDMSNHYDHSVRRALEKHLDPDSEGDTHLNGQIVGIGSACIFSWLSMQWALPVIRTASRQTQIDLHELPILDKDLRQQDLAAEILQQRGWTGKVSSREFMWRMWHLQGRAILLSMLYDLIQIPLDYVPHISLQMFLHSLDNGSAPAVSAAWASVQLVSRIVKNTLLMTKRNLNANYIYPRFRAHASFLIYNKLLTRNLYAKAEGKAGTSRAEILNLVGGDSITIGNISYTLTGVVTAHLELLLGGFYIWQLLGPSGLLGFSALIFTAIPTYFISKKQYSLSRQRKAKADEIVSSLQEAIQAISMIKMMAAEAFWYRRIRQTKKEEMKLFLKAALWSNLSSFLYMMAPCLLIMVSFAHYTLVQQKPLTAAVAFTSLSVFAQMQSTLMALPRQVTGLLNQRLALLRIVNFINMKDVDTLDAKPSTGELYIRGTIGWTTPSDKDASSFTLELDTAFPKGQITLIAGKFGSGKTLAILALLGEVKVVSGEVGYATSDVVSSHARVDWSTLEGVAYCPQVAWLQSQSIRDNILFGLPLNIERYRRVVHAVGLVPDFAVLEDADLTEIGERGKILSGGQKARVSLARAIYSRAATLILDDIISAVDASTSRHIVTHCFQSDLTAGRTIIIASHAVEALAPISHQGIFLEDGKAVFTGTGPALLASEHMAHLHTAGAEREIALEAAAEDIPLLEIKESSPKTPRQLVEDEQRGQGAVSGAVWLRLLRACGGSWFWIMQVVMILLVNLSSVLSAKVLERWTHDPSGIASFHAIVFWVALYSSTTIMAQVINQIEGLWSMYGGYRAMLQIHGEMLSRLLRATMPFFSKTRAGSIVQRFGRDLWEVSTCNYSVLTLSHKLVSICITLITVSTYGGWRFALFMVLVFALVYRPARWYQSAMRQVRRLEKVVPGLVNAVYGESIAGIAVIRAFGAQSMFTNVLLQTMNMKVTTTTWRLYVNRWLFFITRVVDFVVVTAVLSFILLNGHMSASTAGFVLSFVTSLSSTINASLMNLRDLQVGGVSLERLEEYRRLPQEVYEPGVEEVQQLSSRPGTPE